MAGEYSQAELQSPPYPLTTIYSCPRIGSVVIYKAFTPISDTNMSSIRN